MRRRPRAGGPVRQHDVHVGRVAAVLDEAAPRAEVEALVPAVAGLRRCRRQPGADHRLAEEVRARRMLGKGGDPGVPLEVWRREHVRRGELHVEEQLPRRGGGQPAPGGVDRKVRREPFGEIEVVGVPQHAHVLPRPVVEQPLVLQLRLRRPQLARLFIGQHGQQRDVDALGQIVNEARGRMAAGGHDRPGDTWCRRAAAAGR